MVTTNEAAGRDGAGRFAAGNGGGPGRPRRTVERDYLLALAEECGVETWRKIVRRAVEDAEKGDNTARVWLAKYLLPLAVAGSTPPLVRAAADEKTCADPVGREVKWRREVEWEREDEDEGAPVE